MEPKTAFVADQYVALPSNHIVNLGFRCHLTLMQLHRSPFCVGVGLLLPAPQIVHGAPARTIGRCSHVRAGTCPSGTRIYTLASSGISMAAICQTWHTRKLAENTSHGPVTAVIFITCSTAQQKHTTAHDTHSKQTSLSGSCCDYGQFEPVTGATVSTNVVNGVYQVTK